MATKIIRYSNRAEFKIENLVVDFATEDVEVVDYVHIDENHIYFIGGFGGFPKELVANEIGSNDWKQALIDHDFYRFNDCEELIKTGHTKATHYHRSVDVYAGLHAKKVVDEMGEKSLAKCYAYIAERRKEHAKNLADIDLVRSTAKNVTATEDTAENIVEDIKWFLDNRKEIKAKCK
jgi:thymidylate synthase